MDEYIKREAALNALCTVSAPTPAESWIVEKCIEKVNDVPAADVAPVVHGRWYDVNSYEHGERAIATCSHCRVRGAVRTKRTEYGFWVINSPMCPNCGARMDGD